MLKRQWIALALCSLFAALGAVDCGSRHVDQSDGKVATESAALSPVVAVTISVPNPVSPTAPVLIGSSGVSVNSNSTVVTGTVVAMGTAGFAAGSSATVNDVWSASTAHLANSVQVRGTLHASSSVLSLGDVVHAQDTSPTFNPPSTLTWNVVFPSGAGANVSVAQGQTQTLAPGLYGTVTVGSTATLKLSAGTYYLAGLSVQPQAKVSVDQTNGPVVVYVSATIVLGGTFYTTPSGSAPNFAIAYLGSTAFTVGDTSCTIISGTCGPFSGALVAPSATLTLQAVKTGVHTGYFAAKQVVLAASAFVQYAAPTALVAASTPNLVCVQNLGPSQYVALFGYNNLTAGLTNVPVGPKNQISPGPAGQGQVEDFLPILNPGAFSVIFNGSNLTWTLAGGAAVASSQAPACPTTSCSPACRQGQQCVGGQCVTECGDGLCGGDESCNTCPADCACGAGQICVQNMCATSIQCGVEWQCGTGTAFGAPVNCGTCASGKTCTNHVCR